MGISWCRETVGDRTLELAQKDGGSAGRSFIVRVDDPATSLSDIRSQPGIEVGDAHPEDDGLQVDTISVKAADDTGMLYTVSVSYKPGTKQGSEGGDGDSDDGDTEDKVDGEIAQWAASSSVSSEPITVDVNGNTMTNSAGDPLEGLEAERAQFHLTKTEYYNFQLVWLARARDYTNAVNSNVWNGGLPGQWKCQGSSARIQTDNQGANGARRVYWEVTWEFAYRADYWVLKPWDIGFNELCDEDGNTSPQYDISTGDSDGYTGGGSGGGSGDNGPCAGGLKRRAILGQDGRPVRQPVALEGGVAKPPCTRPNELWFNIYPERDFSVFGEVFTPPA